MDDHLENIFRSRTREKFQRKQKNQFEHHKTHLSD